MLERAHRRRYVCDRDEAGYVRRAREEQAAIVAADDRDRVPIEVVVLARRRERDVDRHRRRRAAERDHGLAFRLAAEQRVLELAVRE